MKTHKVLGSILGLALGDAFGAPHEGGPLERAVWRLIGRTKGRRRWTDDTQMTLNIIESLVQNGQVNQDDIAKRFAKSYRWSRGYGPGAAKVLKRIRKGQKWEKASLSVYSEGSFGNGGAMRSPAIGLFLSSENDEDIAITARKIAAITHGHPLAQEGASLIALATALAHSDVGTLEIMERIKKQIASEEFSNRLDTSREWLTSESAAIPKKVAVELGNGIAATHSCMSATYVALAHRERPFKELMDFTIQMGGDVDTISAMAAAIWGAGRGVNDLPTDWVTQLEAHEEISRLARALAESTNR